MVVERASAHLLPKPWGVLDLRPWSDARHDGGAIGEIHYERPISRRRIRRSCSSCCSPTSRFPSRFIPTMRWRTRWACRAARPKPGTSSSAAPGAQVALGLDRRLTPQQLREAVDDGSISDLVRWRTVAPDDIVVVPAGTIHAIGAGLVIAEIQQRSDTTFRLFDYGRQRELHAEQAIAAADAGPARVLEAGLEVLADPLAEARTLLVANAHFVFERLDLAADSAWRLDAERETWLLVVSGGARRRIVRSRPGRCRFRASGPHRDPRRRDRHGGPRGLHGREPAAAPAATLGTAVVAGHGAATGRPRADFAHARKGGPDGGAPGDDQMTSLRRVAFIGNHLPRRCGIATFTHDLHRSVATARPDLETCVVAMTDPGGTYDYPPAVRLPGSRRSRRRLCRGSRVPQQRRIRRRLPSARIRNFRRRRPADNIIELLSRLDMPIVTTLHTVLPAADARPARRHASDHRCFGQARGHVRKGPRIPSRRACRSGPQDRDHTARNTGLPVPRNASRQGEIRVRRKDDHSHVRPAVAQQGHRGHARRHAGHHPFVPERGLCDSRRDPSATSCSSRARPIATA